MFITKIDMFIRTDTVENDFIDTATRRLFSRDFCFSCFERRVFFSFFGSEVKTYEGSNWTSEGRMLFVEVTAPYPFIAVVFQFSTR